jgi:hypothetical protein
VSVWQNGIAVLLGLQGVVGVLSPLRLFVPQIAPTYVLWIQVPESIATFVLAVAVARGDVSAIRKRLALVLVLSATLRVAWLFSPLPLVDVPLVDAWWVSLPLAIMLATAGVGVWRAHEWGRRSCLILGIALVASQLYSLVSGYFGVEGRTGRGTAFLIVMLIALPMLAAPYVALGIYGVRQSTRRHFADVREARARAVPS